MTRQKISSDSIELHGRNMRVLLYNIQIVSNNRKNPTKSRHPKIDLPNFPTRKIQGGGGGQFQTPQNPSIILVTLTLELPPNPPLHPSPYHTHTHTHTRSL